MALLKHYNHQLFTQKEPPYRYYHIRMVLLRISISVGLKSRVPSGLGDFFSSHSFYNLIYFVKKEYDFFYEAAADQLEYINGHLCY